MFVSVLQLLAMPCFLAKERTKTQDLMLRLDKEHPNGDVGVLAPIFLNHFSLRPGESTFLGPNEPHAYLRGDCVE